MSGHAAGLCAGLVIWPPSASRSASSTTHSLCRMQSFGGRPRGFRREEWTHLRT